MSEEANEVAPVENVEAAVEPTENVEPEAVLADAPEGEEAKPEHEINQEAVNRAIGKQHQKFKAEERKRLDTEKQLSDVQAQLNKLQPEQAGITIPPVPDAWDEDHDRLMLERDTAIQNKARLEQQNQSVKDNEFRAQQAAQVKAQQDTKDTMNGYMKNAEVHGIKEADLVIAANKVADSGVSPDVAQFLLTDPDGPLMTAYLADDRHVQDLIELGSMSPVLAGMKLLAIKEKSKGLRQKTTDTPAPADVVTGRGNTRLEDRPMIAGANFE